jgi:2-polyprenyl-3-methyl-5-hydroxy-6-metoxy-1,4-benzoquinol methylase
MLCAIGDDGMADKKTTRAPENERGYEVQASIGPTRLGVLKNWEWHDDPKRVMISMSRYKFVAKMFEGRKNVLEFGCGDAFNAPIVRQGVNKLTVTDFDPVFIADAKERMKPRWDYDAYVVDITKDDMPAGPYDGIYSLDVLEHLPAEWDDLVIGKLTKALTPDGTCIIGMPSLESQIYASPQSKDGHINCKTAPDLKALMQRYFHSVFIFSMNDEVVHTGFHKMAHYIIALCAHKK